MKHSFFGNVGAYSQVHVGSLPHSLSGKDGSRLKTVNRWGSVHYQMNPLRGWSKLSGLSELLNYQKGREYAGIAFFRLHAAAIVSLVTDSISVSLNLVGHDS